MKLPGGMLISSHLRPLFYPVADLVCAATKSRELLTEKWTHPLTRRAAAFWMDVDVTSEQVVGDVVRKWVAVVQKSWNRRLD